MTIDIAAIRAGVGSYDVQQIETRYLLALCDRVKVLEAQLLAIAEAVNGDANGNISATSRARRGVDEP